MNESHPHPHPPHEATPPDFTSEEYTRILARNSFSMQMLSDRVAVLTRENVELLSIVRELQADLAQARAVLGGLQQSEQTLAVNGPQT